MTGHDASSSTERPRHTEVSRRMRWRKAWRWALLLTVLVALPMSLLIGPVLRDHHFVRMARSAHDATQQRGFAFIARHASDASRVHRLALKGMFGNRDTLLGTQEALERAGVWQPPPEDAPAWRRQTYHDWCLTMGTWALDTDHETAAFGWQELTRFLPDDAVALDVIHNLMRTADHDAFSQHQTRMDAMNFWSRSLIADDVWSRWAIDLAESDDPTHRRRAAWVLAELLPPDAPAGTTEHEALLKLLGDSEPEVRLESLHALAEWAGPEPDARIRQAITERTANDRPYVEASARRWLEVTDATSNASDPKISEVAVPTVDPTVLRAMLASEDDERRALAAWWLARHHAETAGTLPGELLNSYDDREKMSGAMIAGITGASLDVLRAREASEDVETVRQAMRLGLWASGTLETETARAHALMRGAGPLQATALIAGLHRHDQAALDYLLGPRQTPGPDAIRLLFEQSLIHVVMATVPDTAPGVDPQANEVDRAEAFERLRMWYRVHRKRFSSAETVRNLQVA